MRVRSRAHDGLTPRTLTPRTLTPRTLTPRTHSAHRLPRALSFSHCGACLTARVSPRVWCRWKHVDASDSRNLSRYLLDTYNTHEREVRMGAAVVSDTLNIQIHLQGADLGLT